MDVRGLGFPMGETPFDSTPAVLEFPPLFQSLNEGTCGSADRFEMVEHEPHCEVVDMEAYALAKVCHHEKVSFACVKYVTDGADGHAHNDWKTNVALAAHQFVRLYEEVSRHA
jgi:adenosylhomocysteine nucleosidase